MRRLLMGLALVCAVARAAFADDKFLKHDIEVDDTPRTSTTEILDPAKLNRGHLWILSQFNDRTGIDQRPFAFRWVLLMKFFDDTGGTYDFSDATLRKVVEKADAGARAKYFAERLKMDLDNDGRISRSEFEFSLRPLAVQPLSSSASVSVPPTPQQVQFIMDELLAKAMREDTNGDGSVDFEEMRHAAGRIRADPKPEPSARSIILLDADGDKVVTHDEFVGAINAVYALVDLDHNGNVDEEETRRAHKKYLPGLQRFLKF